eukprot:maker-scaffold2159_size19648-snap-gene-0.1 protein:Tk00553 transcript:maker-scaffold2159_size19648-snap-gene-0.1-mRNA-1 annotation:"hypothetical protein DAPPUDRAFT_260349"
MHLQEDADVLIDELLESGIIQPAFCKAAVIVHELSSPYHHQRRQKTKILADPSTLLPLSSSDLLGLPQAKEYTSQKHFLKYDAKARDLSPLSVGAPIRLQDPSSKLWASQGVVTSVLDGRRNPSTLLPLSSSDLLGLPEAKEYTSQKYFLKYDAKARDLSPLSVGAPIRLQDPSSKLWASQGVVTSVLDGRRSYRVRLMDGREFTRNRIYIRRDTSTDLTHTSSMRKSEKKFNFICHKCSKSTMVEKSPGLGQRLLQ